MDNFYLDNDDLRFYLERDIDWKPLVELTEFGFKAPDGFKDVDEALDFYKSAIELVGEFAAKEVAPHAATIDLEHPFLEDGVVHFPPVLQNIFDQVRDMGLHGMCLPREMGGMNCPFIVFTMSNEILARADVSVSAHFGFHGGIAMAMLLYSAMEGSAEFDREKMAFQSTRFDEAIAEIVSGEAWGSMDITEPGAGSDMAQLRSKGELGKDGTWRVTGEKIFITSGHAKYHFVIARTEKKSEDADAFAGLKGLSMFLVPTYEIGEDGTRTQLATFEKCEEKLGHHGSATVAVRFDETPALLIGQRGEGFKLMLQLMNNARVSVGFEALGISETALRMAREYAAERTSMGKTIDHHEMVADYLDEMHTDIQGIRAMAVNSAWHEEMGQKLSLLLQFDPPESKTERRKMERRMKTHQATARRYTPLLKYLGAEKAVEIARRAIQIHGGYGYSMEFGAEKLLRDAMVLPIYEGTSQIQALMAMKDNLMGILKDPKSFLEGMARATLASRVGGTDREKRVAGLQATQYKALQFLMTRLAGKKIAEMRKKPMDQWLSFFQDWDPKKDFALAMLHAERLTRILADVAVCELLLQQSKRHEDRSEVLDRYLERAETRCQHLYREITTTGKRLLADLEEKEGTP